MKETNNEYIKGTRMMNETETAKQEAMALLVVVVVDHCNNVESPMVSGEEMAKV